MPSYPRHRRTEGGLGVQPPTPKFRSFEKTEPNSQFRGKHIRKKPTKNTGFTHFQN
jgi:hypothetical protein